MYLCEFCGKPHNDVPTDLAYRRPVHFFMVPEAERPARIKHNDDICIVDDTHFLIRGILEVPVIDQPGINLTWGIWASVSQESFDKYFELYDEDGSGEPSFKGLLAVSPNGYPDLYDHEVRVQLRTASERPLFIPASMNHPLFAECRDGITTKRWHDIVFTAMPWLRDV